MRQRLIVRLAIILALFLPTALTAWAQSAGTKAIAAITFKPGAQTTVVEGTVSPPVTAGPDMTDDGSERYTVRARAGQFLTLELRSDNHKALISLTKPSPAMAKHEIIGVGAERISARLRESGNYLVTAFTEDRTAVSHYRLRVTLR